VKDAVLGRIAEVAASCFEALTEAAVEQLVIQLQALGDTGVECAATSC
jgi:hypothetical protein